MLAALLFAPLALPQDAAVPPAARFSADDAAPVVAPAVSRTAAPPTPADAAAEPVFGRVQDAGEARLTQMLDARASLPDFFEQPVQDVLDALSAENGLTVVPLDDETRSLMTDGLTTQPPLDGIPLRGVLDLVLHPRGLDWYPRGGVLMIASRAQMRSQAGTLVRVAPDAETAGSAADVLNRLFEPPAADARTGTFTPRRTDPRGDGGTAGPLQIAAFGKAVVVRGSWADLREVDVAFDQLAAGVGAGGVRPRSDPPPADVEDIVIDPPAETSRDEAADLGLGG